MNINYRYSIVPQIANTYKLTNYSCRCDNKLRFALCFFLFSMFSSMFSYLLQCIELDLGTRIHTARQYPLRENFESTILGIQCDQRCFASANETNLGFIVCCCFTKVLALEYHTLRTQIVAVRATSLINGVHTKNLSP